MALDLPALARQQGIRRSSVTLRPIVPTQAQSTELARITAASWQTWAQNIDRIMAGYDPAPLPTSDTLIIDTAEDVSAAIQSAAEEFIHRLVTEITPALRRFSVEVERWHRTKWASAVSAGTGINLSTVLSVQPVTETLGTWLARNVALCRNVSDQAQGRISDAVFRGYQNRTPAREVAKEIRGAVDMGRRRSIRIASDQSSKLSAALDDERRAEAGITEYKWRHSGKAHPRPEHQARNGKVYKNGLPSGDTPGQAPYCGCRAQAYIPLLDEIA